MKDWDYMGMALALAKEGCGWVSPNPMVGAVVVKEGRVIGQGYHARYGEKHAERNALEACQESPAGATLYVTLEPCCHHGKQPPCVDAILEAGIRRVVVGSGDPNPLVNGKGTAILRAHGVEVTEGVMQEECDRLNRVFFHYIRTGRPYVALKYAMTLDGKTAAYTGASRWITGEEARRHVHRLRHRYRGILVGAGTVLADDPLLTCRMEGGRNPVRIVCDSRLRIPLSSQLAQTAREIPTILAVCRPGEGGVPGTASAAAPGTAAPAMPEPTASAWKARAERFRQAGCQVWELPGHGGQVDLAALLDRLGQEQIDSVLVEGGGTLGWSFLWEGLAQRVFAYLAPKILGGRQAPTPVEGQGFPSPGEAVRLKTEAVLRLGEDILVESEVIPCVHRID